MLSFKSLKNSRPVAMIRGGEHDKKLVYVTPPDFNKRKKRGRPKKEHELPYDLSLLINDPIFRSIKRSRREKRLQKIIKKIKMNDIDKNDVILTKVIKKKKANREIILHDGDMIPLPRLDARECIYITGPSESGKSTWIGSYLEQFKKIFPDKDTFVFSAVKRDSILDVHKPTRMLIDRSMLKDPIDVEELSTSLVIFDDANSVRDKKVKAEIVELQDALLEVGRHEGAYVIISSHMSNKGNETKIILNECPSIVVFPYSGNSHSIGYCLKEYYGLDQKQINKILALPSRWAFISRIAPKWVMYQNGIYLL
jgi:hypothetical protein